MTEFTAALFVAAGLSPAAADWAAEAIVEADLQGKTSHGVLQATAYLDRLLAGSITTGEEIVIVHDTGAAVVVDAQAMLGHLAAEQAVGLAVERAKQHGVATVAMRNGFHFGVAGRYATMAAQAGCVGIVMCNTRPTMPPPGGAERLVGTNPVAIAIPTAEAPHIVFDMATSAGSVGRVRQAQAAGKPIPEGWATDAEGTPTTDAAAALKGFLLPVGGAKGFGLSLIVDLLCGLLASGGWGPTLGEMRGDLTKPYNGSSLFIVLDIAHFRPLPEFLAEAQAGAERVRRAKRAPGVDRLYTPGERAWESQQVGTVAIDAPILSGLNDMARRLGVPPLA